MGDDYEHIPLKPAGHMIAITPEKYAALESDRDELRAEVERLKKEAAEKQRQSDEQSDYAVSIDESRAEFVNNLQQQLAAARDGSLQAVFDAVVRWHSQDEWNWPLSRLAHHCNITNTTVKRAQLSAYCERHNLSTAVLDELWGEGTREDQR